MTKVTAAMVKELRELTGIGMSKCKEALVETNGDIKEAADYLRKKGLASAVKKQDRAANEGLIGHIVSDTGYALVELHCETDFVEKTEDFKSALSNLAEEALKAQPKNLEEFLSHKMEDGSTVQETTNLLIAKLGENIGISRVYTGKKIENCSYAVYQHNNGKMVSLVELEGANDAGDLAKKLAMHVTASSPVYIDSAEVPQEIIAKEKEISQERNAGKPAHILEKISEGSVKKYFGENCFLNQSYLYDDSKTVEQILGKLKVKSFINWRVGS